MIASSPSALPQSTHPDHTAAAGKLLEEGKIDSAMQILRSGLSVERSDAGALRLMARALYWSGKPDEAGRYYEEALVLDPQNEPLQLEFARMLAETGKSERAKIILISLTVRGGSKAEALELLGTLLYWGGDWTGASRYFEEALALDRGRTEARRQWKEIAGVTATSAAIGLEYQDDSQPIRRSILTGELDLRLTPLQRLLLTIQPQTADVSDSSRSVFHGELAWKQTAPSLGLETRISAGVLKRSFAEVIDGTWGLMVGLRLPGHFVVRGKAERVASLYASASLSTPVMVTLAGVELDWVHPAGRLGRVVLERIRFADKNILERFSGWLLVPLTNSSAGSLSMGYGFNAQHAGENRFTLVQDVPPYQGIYTPYYTPTNLKVHNVLGAVQATFSPGMTFRLSGSYGIIGTEDAPAFVADATPPSRPTVSRVFFPRNFHPHQIKVGLTYVFHLNGTLALEGTRSSTSFYDLTQVSIRFSYRFPSATFD